MTCCDPFHMSTLEWTPPPPSQWSAPVPTCAACAAHSSKAVATTRPAIAAARGVAWGRSLRGDNLGLSTLGNLTFGKIHCVYWLGIGSHEIQPCIFQYVRLWAWSSPDKWWVSRFQVFTGYWTIVCHYMPQYLKRRYILKLLFYPGE